MCQLGLEPLSLPVQRADLVPALRVRDLSHQGPSARFLFVMRFSAQWVVGLMRATRTRAVRGSALAQSSSGAHLIEAALACRVDRGGEGRSRAIAACLWVAFASDRLVATADGACAIARRQWPPGHCARTEASLDGFVVLSHHRRSEAQRGAIGAAGQPSQASDETLANRPRRKSRSAGWDASSSAIL